MKNKEIERILKYLKNNTYIPDETKRKYKILHRDEVNLLLSYIEQLEEELKYSIGIVQHNQIVTKLSKEKKQLENNRDKALKIIDSYDLGKYDYSIPAGGIIELRETLKGDSDYD